VSFAQQLFAPGRRCRGQILKEQQDAALVNLVFASLVQCNSSRLFVLVLSL
jgi:hypothetical protein